MPEREKRPDELLAEAVERARKVQEANRAAGRPEPAERRAEDIAERPDQPRR